MRQPLQPQRPVARNPVAALSSPRRLHPRRPESPHHTRDRHRAQAPHAPRCALNLVSFLLQSPHAHTARLAFVDAEQCQQVLEGPALRDAIAGHAAAFRACSDAGDRIFIALPQGPTLALALLGAIAAGRVAVPLAADLTPPELHDLVSRFRPSVLLSNAPVPGLPDGVDRLDADEIARLVDRERRHRHSAFAATEPEDAAWMVFTSGTTGRPRGVLHAHRSVRGRLPMDRGWTGLSATDIVLHAGTLNWTYAMGLQLLDALRLGATSLIHVGERPPDIWGGLVDRWEVSTFAAVPSVFRRILKHDNNPARLARLRAGLTAGEALSPALLEQWTRTVGSPLLEALGMSECSTFISSGPETPTRPGSPGRPQRGRRVAILPEEGGVTPCAPDEPGILAVHRSDPGLMLGYADDPDATRSAFRGEWFLTGDLGCLDPEGYFQHRGRLHDRLNVLGYRVAAAEVERLLGDHPAIAEAAVGECHIRDGVTVLGALLVLHPGHGLDATSLARWLRDNVARHKQPRRFRVVDGLPRSRNGKVLRTQVDAMTRHDGHSVE